MKNAVLDHEWLGQSCFDVDSKNRIEQFVAFLGLILIEKQLCRLYVANDWSTHYQVSGSALHYKTDKEMAELIQRLLARCQSEHESFNAAICAAEFRSRCLVFAITEPKPSPVQCEEKQIAVHTCSDRPCYEVFWRTILENDNLGSGEFDSLVDQAFWGLVWSPSARDNWDKMGASLTSIRAGLVRHLSYLSDSCAHDFKETAGVPVDFQGRAGGAGVDMSPEGNLSGKSLKQREAHFEGTAHVCRWHTKLTSTQGRIHFTVLENGLVLVGIVTDHLSTN